MIESTKFPRLTLDLMDGTKIVFVNGRNVLNRENTLCCFKELHHHLVFLRCLIVASILLFSPKKNGTNNLPMHPRERLPLTAPKITDSRPNIDLQHGRFFVTNEEFRMRVNEICFQFWKIQSFAKFVYDNHHKIKDRHLVCGDLHMFADFLLIFLTREFVDPKGMFRKICRQHPFEFLMMFDLCRE